MFCIRIVIFYSLWYIWVIKPTLFLQQLYHTLRRKSFLILDDFLEDAEYLIESLTDKKFTPRIISDGGLLLEQFWYICEALILDFECFNSVWF